jgi:hypothetical protein
MAATVVAFVDEVSVPDGEQAAVLARSLGIFESLVEAADVDAGFLANS